MAENKKTTKKSTTTKTTSKKTTAKKTTKKAPVKKEVKTVKEVKKVETPVVETKPEVKKENSFMAFIKNNSRNIILGLICILLVINIVLVVMGHKVKLSDGNEVIASIDGKDYTAEQLFETLKERYGKDVLISLIDEHISEKELDKNDLKEAKEEAKEYIDSIKSQYESAGYKWEEVLAQYGYENEDTLLNEYLVSVKQQFVVTKEIEKDLKDDEIKKYYDENIYGTYTVKHILVKPATTDEMSDEEKATAEEAAKNKAQEAINKYAEGTDWATLVNEYSEDEASKESEGLIENFTKGDVVDSFFNASIELKDGEYTSEPVKSDYGYHVILKVSSTEKASLEDSKKDIISALVNEKLSSDQNLYRDIWVKVRNNYKLSIEDTVIKTSYEKSINE